MIKSNNNFKIFIRLLKAQTFNYITDPINIILGIVLTTVTMLCWVALNHDADSGLLADSFVLASAIGISSIRNSQYNLNLTLADWRNKISKKFINHSYFKKSFICINFMF
nr:hypothetical protein [Entomoplasma sp. MP1]